MCGIAGVLYADPDRPVERGLLERMGSALSHRGPDGEGYFCTDPGIGLVHRRLAIIDLATGDQPMGNEDGSIQVIFNGEIYNHRELRSELAQRGHVFRTESDTEVLVHLYEEQGVHLVERLRGMFALAIWDRRQRRLTLARDRVGLKPLYIYRDEEKLIFASELKAILTGHDIDRSLDLESIDDYLCFGMIPGERSIFRRVGKLPAAHTLELGAAAVTADLRPRRYWQYTPAADRLTSLEQWKERVLGKIDETVNAHRLSDVPIGALLSGGVDSSVIVALLSAAQGRPLKTFSIGFDEARFSELPHAREVARRFGCEHVEEVVRPEAASSLDDLVRYYDEPFADSSAVPSLAVARLASQHVKVVLTGDGGDECFGGYARYAHDLAEAYWRQRIPGWVRQGPLRLLARRWPRGDWLPRYLRAKTTLTNLALDAPGAYANTLAAARRPQRRQLLHPDLRTKLNGRWPEGIVCWNYNHAPPDDPLAGMISADVGVLLPDQFLTKVDRATMAVGLEARPPLVDHELLELTAQLPSEYKVCRGETKWLLKELFRDRLPAAVTRRAKQGFDIPLDAWLRGPLRSVFHDTVLAAESCAAELIDQRRVATMFRSHLRGTGRHGQVLWSLLVLARWCEGYLPQPQGIKG